MKKILHVIILAIVLFGFSDFVFAGQSYRMEAGEGLRQLLIVGNDKQSKAVRLDQTTAHKFVSPRNTIWRTDDSLWDAMDPKTGKHTQSQWINYTVKPGKYYSARVHCQYEPASNEIKVSLEIREIGGAYRPEGNCISFVDWQGNVWTAFFEPIKGQFGYPKCKIVSGDHVN